MDKVLPIQSASGEHFGFILFSGDPPSGDCIFQLLPGNSDAFHDPAFRLLETHGFRTAGEHRWQLRDGVIYLALSRGGSATIDLAGGRLVFDAGNEYTIGTIMPNEPAEDMR